VCVFFNVPLPVNWKFPVPPPQKEEQPVVSLNKLTSTFIFAKRGKAQNCSALETKDNETTVSLM
jgi:hypothetical protein